jgi:hypothetical protein
MRIATPVTVNPAQRVELRRVLQSRMTPQAIIRHVRVVLLPDEGLEIQAVAERLSMSINGVGAWRDDDARLQASWNGTTLLGPVAKQLKSPVMRSASDQAARDLL